RSQHSFEGHIRGTRGKKRKKENAEEKEERIEVKKRGREERERKNSNTFQDSVQLTGCLPSSTGLLELGKATEKGKFAPHMITSGTIILYFSSSLLSFSFFFSH